MGIYKEHTACEGEAMTNNEETGNSKDIWKKLIPYIRKNKAACYLFLSLILAIFILIVAIIIVSILGFKSHKKNDEKTKSHSLTDNVTVIKNQNPAPCEDDWIWYRGKCYYFSTIHDTWNNSQRFCNSHNATLALIENPRELDFLFRFKDLGNHWIGLRRTDDNTAWTWINGTSYTESLFKITRSSHEHIEYVYLNSKDVKSEGGNFDFKWICNRT